MDVDIPHEWSRVLAHPEIETYRFEDDGTYPNNPSLPAVVMREAFAPAQKLAGRMDRVFGSHEWRGSWRNGIFSYHHYHSTAHEVLGVAAGSARVQLGGPDGTDLRISARDVVVLPAGVAHKNLEAAADFLVVGAYPANASDWDLLRGRPGERERALDNIRQVPAPGQDPVYGSDGPLLAVWQ